MLIDKSLGLCRSRQLAPGKQWTEHAKIRRSIVRVKPDNIPHRLPASEACMHVCTMQQANLHNKLVWLPREV